MNTMIDRMANAIFAAMDVSDSLTPTEATRYAAAALEAMMEPTDEMIQAGVSEDQTDDVYRDVRSIFAAMIQAALKEGQ